MGREGAIRYKVDIQGLKNGEHKFKFPVDSRFFEKFENSPVSKGQLECQVILNKSDRLIEVILEIDGTVELECDRSLELFDQPLKVSKEVLYKYGADYDELDDEVFQIPDTADRIELTDLIYQFIILEIPMKKIHPKYKDQEEDDSVFYSTDEGNDEKENQDTDPRWAALKDLGKK